MFLSCNINVHMMGFVYFVRSNDNPNSKPTFCNLLLLLAMLVLLHSFSCCKFGIINPIWHGGPWWPPKMFLTTVPKRLAGGSWNLVTFYINLFSIKKSYFWFPRLSIVFKSKIWVDIWRKHLKIPPTTKFQQNQSGGLRVTSIWNSGLHLG